MSEPYTATHPQQLHLEAALVMALGQQARYEVRMCELHPNEIGRNLVKVGMMDKTTRKWVATCVPEELFNDLPALADYLRDRLPYLLSKLL